MSVMEKEPANALGAVGGVLNAVLVVAVAYGLKLTEEQRAALTALTVAVGTAATAFGIRSRVYAPASFNELRRALPVYDAVRAALKALPADVQSDERGVQAALRSVARDMEAGNGK